MKRIKFHTLGCKANQYDTQSIREKFLARGFQETAGKTAEYFLVNTCTVTSGADQKSRNIIRRCVKANPKAVIIVTGCMAEKDWGCLADIKGVSLIVRKSFFPEEISGFRQHTRAFLKIQDGCDNFCTYCKVAQVRGRKRSKGIGWILREAGNLVGGGFREIVLTGICLGSYGSDITPKASLVQVIESLQKIKGLERIRLSSIEAGDVSPALIELMAVSKKLCRHLHIPIQSGDSRILKLMNRKYTAKDYERLIAGIKRRIPDIALTTDCLVGFPGEEESNFANTVSLLRKILPLKTHIFPYSLRPGTPAASFGGKVDPAVISRRCVELEKSARECSVKVMRGFSGREYLVLIERISKAGCGYLEGFTDNYLKVRLPYRPGLINRLVKVKLGEPYRGIFSGEYIDNP